MPLTGCRGRRTRSQNKGRDAQRGPTFPIPAGQHVFPLLRNGTRRSCGLHTCGVPGLSSPGTVGARPTFRAPGASEDQPCLRSAGPARLLPVPPLLQPWRLCSPVPTPNPGRPGSSVTRVWQMWHCGMFEPRPRGALRPLLKAPRALRRPCAGPLWLRGRWQGLDGTTAGRVGRASWALWPLLICRPLAAMAHPRQGCPNCLGLEKEPVNSRLV